MLSALHIHLVSVESWLVGRRRQALTRRTLLPIVSWPAHAVTVPASLSPAVSAAERFLNATVALDLIKVPVM